MSLSIGQTNQVSVELASHDPNREDIVSQLTERDKLGECRGRERYCNSKKNMRDKFMNSSNSYTNGNSENSVLP